MQKQILLAIAIAGLGPNLASAQSTVNFTAGIGQRTAALEANMPVPDGNYVSIGYFNPGFDLGANADDASALSAAWNEYGSTTIRTIFGQPGSFGGTQSSTDPRFDNQQIWLWLFKTSDNGKPLADFSNLEGYGLFSGPVSIWRFPAQGTIPPNNTINVDSDQVDQALYGSFDPLHLYLHPLAIVPEPSVAALLAAALAALSFHSFNRGRRP